MKENSLIFKMASSRRYPIETINDAANVKGVALFKKYTSPSRMSGGYPGAGRNSYWSQRELR